MAKKEFSMTCEVCGDEVVGVTGEYGEAKCKGCGSFFEYDEGMHIKLTGEQCRKLANQTKPIQTFFGDTKVGCVQAKDPKTGHVRHWVCKSPEAQRELKARLEKDPECWIEISSYYALVHDEGDKHARVPK